MYFTAFQQVASSSCFVLRHAVAVALGERRTSKRTTSTLSVSASTADTCTHSSKCARSSDRSCWRWGESFVAVPHEFVVNCVSLNTVLSCIAASVRCPPTGSWKAASGTSMRSSSRSNIRRATHTTHSSSVVSPLLPHVTHAQ